MAIILGLNGLNPETFPVDSISTIIEAVNSKNQIRFNNEYVLGFNPKEDIIFDKTFLPFHSNGMKFTAVIEGKKHQTTFYSIGGGFVVKEALINAKENIEIKCFKHNQTFYQTSNNHFNSKYPCEKCKKQHRRRLYADGIDKFIKKMSSKFGDAFDYSNTNYINAKTKVQLICKKCKAEIFSDPYVLLNGKGCPACYQNKSKTEFKIKKLKEINIKDIEKVNL